MTEPSNDLGVLMLDVEGLSLSKAEQSSLSRDCVGGVILFSRNYVSPTQLGDLVSAIRACKPHILIAVDQEGGRVQRFREGFLTLPPLHVLDLLLDSDAQQAVRTAELLAWAMAAEIRHYGIDFSFAPVLDLFSLQSRVIGDRAFAAEPARVSQLARSYIAGMHRAGMAATGKHFPGHGSVEADSHHELPTDTRSESAILSHDFKPFADCIDVLDAVMPAHVVYPAVDSVCAGYSKIWIEQKLRTELGFEGVVFSDDLTMAAAHSAGAVEQRALLSLQAGCDMVLVCNDPAAALKVADKLEAEPPAVNERLAAMRGRPAPVIGNLHDSDEWLAAVALVESLNHTYIQVTK